MTASSNRFADWPFVEIPTRLDEHQLRRVSDCVSRLHEAQHDDAVCGVAALHREIAYLRRLALFNAQLVDLYHSRDASLNHQWQLDWVPIVLDGQSRKNPFDHESARWSALCFLQVEPSLGDISSPKRLDTPHLPGQLQIESGTMYLMPAEAAREVAVQLVGLVRVAWGANVSRAAV